MSDQEDLQPKLRREANTILQRLPPSEREALLIKCWMSHDARWFMAAAREFGMPAANRLNQIAVQAIGKLEAQRIVRALQLPPVTSLNGCLLAQEVFIGLLGPDLLDYGVSRVDDHAYHIHVRHCFAHDNVVRAGIADQFECGIFARATSWLDALGLAYEISPAIGKCLKAQGQECLYAITILAWSRMGAEASKPAYTGGTGEC